MSASSWVLNPMLMVPLWLSSSLRKLRECRCPTPFYLFFMQHVLELLTCLVLPDFLTS
jgi:hypothetical protein